MGKLTPAQIDEYFKKHLPYRTGILLAHHRMTRSAWSGDTGQLNACFIAALVTGRLFLNMLGIGKRGGSLASFTPKSDDVTVEDLGGASLDPVALPMADQAFFLDFLIMADKAAAHFTLPLPHDWSRTDEVILRIHHFLAINLYGHTSRQFPDGNP